MIPLSLHEQQEGKLLDVIRKQREDIGWNIFNLKKISPFGAT